MLGILEGLLYVQGDEGLSLKQVMDILNLNEDEARDLVYKLKNSYDSEDRGLRINYLGNTFKLSTKGEHKEYYEKLLDNEETGLLTQTSLETLAIIAYNEPITRNQIDEMRGVDSIYIIRKLLAKGFIKEAGRSELPGRPILYKTTDEFLDYFGLSNISDLPDIDMIEEKVKDEEETDLFKSNYRDDNYET